MSQCCQHKRLVFKCCQHKRLVSQCCQHKMLVSQCWQMYISTTASQNWGQKFSNIWKLNELAILKSVHIRKIVTLLLQNANCEPVMLHCDNLPSQYNNQSRYKWVALSIVMYNILLVWYKLQSISTFYISCTNL